MALTRRDLCWHIYNIYNVIYIFGCVESSLLWWVFSLVVVSGNYSLVAMCRLLIVVTSLVTAQTPGASVVVACELSSCGNTGLVAPPNVDSRTQGLNLYLSTLAGKFFTTGATREVQCPDLYLLVFSPMKIATFPLSWVYSSSAITLHPSWIS